MFERSRRLNSCILFVFLLNKRVWYIKIECMTEIKLYIGLRSSWLGDGCLSPLTMGPWVTFLLQMNSSFLLVFVPIFVISQFYNSSLAAVFTTQNWNFGKQFGKKLKYEFSTNRDVSATLIGVDLDRDVWPGDRRLYRCAVTDTECRFLKKLPVYRDKLIIFVVAHSDFNNFSNKL